MRLICTSRYRSSLGDYTEGQDVDVTDEMAGRLLNDSPGSFKIPTPEKPLDPIGDTEDLPVKVGEAVDEEREEVEGDTLTQGAMSTETATGVTAPDRRARGGKKRRKR